MFQPARLNSAMVASCRLPLGMPSLSLFAIGRLRFLSAQLDRAREATHGSLVANKSIAFHFHAKQQGVAVAVGGCGDDAQAVSTGLPFHPELLSCPAPEGNKACLQRLGVACGVEEPEHQHFAGARIL